jgi:hypothetical protein
MEYITPIWDIEIGSYAVEKLTRFDVYSARYNPTDRAEVELDKKGFPFGTIAKGNRIQICQGYLRHGLWKIFAGKVKDIIPEKNTVLIRAEDLMTTLKETKISRSFVSPVPQDIIRYGLNLAGITTYQLSDKVFQPKSGFVAANEPMTTCLKRIHTNWQLDDLNLDWNAYCTPEEEFFWGTWEESDRYLVDDLPVLELGKNILSHRISKNGDQGDLQIITLPYLRHSHRLKIIDPRYWSQPQIVRIKKAHYHHSEEKARMFLEWEKVS